MRLDKGRVAGRSVLSFAIADSRGKHLVPIIPRPSHKLAHDTILSWVLVTNVIFLAIWEGVLVDPFLEVVST